MNECSVNKISYFHHCDAPPSDCPELLNHGPEVEVRLEGLLGHTVLLLAGGIADALVGQAAVQLGKVEWT